MHYFVLIFFFDFCGFISVAYTTLNKLLAVFFIYNLYKPRGVREDGHAHCTAVLVLSSAAFYINCVSYLVSVI